MRVLATTGSATRLADSDAPTASFRGAAGDGAAVARAAMRPPRRASLRMGGILHSASAGAAPPLPPRGLLLLDEARPVAAGEPCRPRVGRRLLEGRQARLRLLVGVVEARLPTGEVDLVEGVEDEEALHGWLAGGQRERLVVVVRLGVRADRVAGAG